jgi:hypothetical protein
MKLAIVLLLAAGFATHSEARLGESRDQLEARYGLPKKGYPFEASSPLIKGATEMVFEHQGWRIRCALLLAKDGRFYTVRETYQKPSGSEAAKAGGIFIRDFERDAILGAEGGLQKWTKQTRAEPGKNLIDTVARQIVVNSHLTGDILHRGDGATARMGNLSPLITLELPQAPRYEAELKAIEEQKARAAVPSF